MANRFVRINKRSASCQSVLLEYGDEIKLKLRKNDGWGLGRGSKREQMEIIAEILWHCNKHKTKTSIMHKVNLNYLQLKKHLNSLTSKGLLVSDSNMYATTHKGQRFLRLFSQLITLLES